MLYNLFISFIHSTRLQNNLESVRLCVRVSFKPVLKLTYRGTKWIQNPLNFDSCPFESD